MMASLPSGAAAGVSVALVHDGAGDAVLTLTPPASGPPARKCVVAVVDVSYSMHGPANDRGTEVARYFSKLDVVKHGLRTALAGLEDDDLFALVEFSSQARVLLPPQRLGAAGRAAAGAAVDSLVPQASTALWAGLRAGLDALRDAAALDAGALPVLLLLTDGDPSESPAEGEVAAFRAHVHALALHDATLWAFGFGYDGARSRQSREPVLRGHL
jgi:Ca-activated chloride channel family protein